MLFFYTCTRMFSRIKNNGYKEKPYRYSNFFVKISQVNISMILACMQSANGCLGYDVILEKLLPY